jgi:hypothetical protein
MPEKIVLELLDEVSCALATWGINRKRFDVAPFAVTIASFFKKQTYAARFLYKFICGDETDVISMHVTSHIIMETA